MTTSAAASAVRPLLCVSPLTSPGGVDTLLTAFGLLAGDRPGLVLEIVGGGPLGQAFRDHVSDLGLVERVDFCGPLPAPAVRAALRRCALLVLPHRAGGGDHPHATLVTALAYGRPVVATHAVAPPPVLRHGETGLLVPPDDPTALAVAVAGVLDDPGRATALGEAGRRAVAGLPPGAGPPECVPPEVGPLQRLWHRITR